MISVINYKESPDKVISDLPGIIDYLFDKDTLVIYDVRSSIVSHVLPHIPHVAVYDQRVVAMLHNATLVCSEPFHAEIVTLYQSLGLCQDVSIITVPHQSQISLIDQILADNDLCLRLASAGFRRLVTFLPTEQAEILSKKISVPLLNGFVVSQKANDKVALKEFLIESQLPTIPGFITSNRDEVAAVFETGKKYFIKLAHGVSGFGFFDSSKDRIDDFWDLCSGQKVIVEEVIELEASPSVQLYVAEDIVYLLGMTDQILEDGRYYAGNKYPSIYVGSLIEDSIIEQCNVLGDYLHSIGYRGFAGIDLMVAKDQSVYIAEINARFTGATPAKVISLLLHKNLTKSRKFLLYDKIDRSLHDMLEDSNPNNFPICIGGIDEWNKAQILHRD